jgi:hypothetical protein
MLLAHFHIGITGSVSSEYPDVKTNIIGKKRPINKAEMRTNVEDFMNKRKKSKKQVQKYFHQKHVKYAA